MMRNAQSLVTELKVKISGDNKCGTIDYTVKPEEKFLEREHALVGQTLKVERIRVESLTYNYYICTANNIK